MPVFSYAKVFTTGDKPVVPHGWLLAWGNEGFVWTLRWRGRHSKLLLLSLVVGLVLNAD